MVQFGGLTLVIDGESLRFNRLKGWSLKGKRHSDLRKRKCVGFGKNQDSTNEGQTGKIKEPETIVSGSSNARIISEPRDSHVTRHKL